MNTHRFYASGPVTNYEMEPLREGEASGQTPLRWRDAWSHVGDARHFLSQAEWDAQ